MTTEQWVEKILTETPELQRYYDWLDSDPVLKGLDQQRDQLGSPHQDRDGNPISYADWALLFSSMEYRRIAYTEIGPWHVSTVWVGMSGIPGYIFESMVFQNETRHSDRFGFTYHEDLDQRRYRSEDEARQGHAELVRQCEAMSQLNELLDPRDIGV